jgi:hypothetical protein
MVINHENQFRENGKGQFPFNLPFLVIDANTNQRKYKMQKCN